MGVVRSPFRALEAGRLRARATHTVSRRSYADFFLSVSALAIAATIVVSAAGGSAAYANDEDGFGTAAGIEANGGDDDGSSAGNFNAAGANGLGGLTIEGLLYRRKGLATVPFTELGDSPGATATFTMVIHPISTGRNMRPACG